MKRPLGILLISIFFIVGAIYSFLSPIVQAQWVMPPNFFFYIAPSLCMVTLGICLLFLWNWAKLLSILFSVISVAMRLWNCSVFVYWVITKQFEDRSHFLYNVQLVSVEIIWIILWAAIIFYLTRQKVGEAFKKSR